MASTEIYLGLMSGTSLDGVDAVAADFSSSLPRLIATAHLSYPDSLRQRLLELNHSGPDELHRCALAATEATRLYAAAVEHLAELAGTEVPKAAAIGCHGQTVRHRPDAGYSIQLCSPALLAELTGTPVVADFRSRDIAAGGQGAPLVPAFHAAVFHHPERDRVVVNVGGIANITTLPARGLVAGFDTGPGNVLMDLWCSAHRGAAFDENGAWALGGTVIGPLLQAMLEEDYFRRPPPKSTGRDRFNRSWLERHLTGSERPQDVQATLLALTAESICRSVESALPTARDLAVCGGGARNPALMDALQRRVPAIQVVPSDALGIPAQWVEALAFAWLARRALNGAPGNLPAVTGACGERILGAIYPG